MGGTDQEDLERPLAAAADDADLQSPAGAEIRFTFKRRRPMNPSRFIAFVRRHFGEWDDKAHEALWSRDDGSGEIQTRNPAAGGIRRSLGALFCPRRKNASSSQTVDVPPEAVALVAGGPRDRQFGSCVVESVSGCVWLMGSDDKRVVWQFDATGSMVCQDCVQGPRSRKPPSVSRSRQTHTLGRGSQWDSGRPFSQPPEERTEAGERRSELEFVLRLPQGDADVASSEEDAADSKARLKEALERCLITRAEAEEWDRQPQEGEEWIMPTSMATAVGVLHATASLVASLPGFSVGAGAGEAVTSLVARKLGAPRGPGHVPEDAGGDRGLAPCEQHTSAH
eukprot:TRINITY_DN29033_c0_g1_i1.p1 TRINITY_DN29033_c0_g1~~TRINITY_DN29033_c0_g1_i1.p1  ORF type:complete len:339 (-),score=52.87 TRINITY_DN29033_c0_g1_i1:190-1206(-)